MKLVSPSSQSRNRGLRGCFEHQARTATHFGRHPTRPPKVCLPAWVWVSLQLVAAALAPAQEPGQEAACRARLKRIDAAIRAYQIIHDKAPAKLSDLYYDGLIASIGEFVCPASGANIILASEIDTKSDYSLDAAKGTKAPRVSERNARHGPETPTKIPAVDVARKAPPITPSPDVVKKAPTQTSSRIEPTRPAPTPAPATTTPPKLETATSNPDLQTGSDLMRAGRLFEALEVYRRLWTSETDDVLLGLHRGSLELAVGDRPAGLRIAEALLRRHPNHPPVIAFRGIAAFYNADQATAQQMMARARQLDPQSPAAHFQHARAQHQGQVLALALQHYIVAALMEPQRYFASHFSIGQIYESMNRPDLALPAYQSYLYYDQTSEWAAQARAATQRLRAAQGGNPVPTNE